MIFMEKQITRAAGFQDDSPEIEEIADYWKYRSESYSELNIEEMHSWKRKAWRNLILSYAPKKEPMKILDVGTGPGFFAILMALSGNDVSAVDVTAEMLAHAKENARAAGVTDIHFYHHRGERLFCEDGEFDLVVSRNVTWNLEYPADALKEWKRALRPGGRMIYFDANWYRYLFDPEAAKAAEQDARNLRERYPEYTRKVQEKYLFQQGWMEEIVRKLPLSNVKRPQWDESILSEIGMKKVEILPDINARIYDEMEQVRYHSIPMFMVCAEKPE